LRCGLAFLATVSLRSSLPSIDINISFWPLAALRGFFEASEGFDDVPTHTRSMHPHGRSFRPQSVRLVRDQNADEIFSRNVGNLENRMRTQFV